MIPNAKLVTNKDGTWVECPICFSHFGAQKAYRQHFGYGDCDKWAALRLGLHWIDDYDWPVNIPFEAVI